MYQMSAPNSNVLQRIVGDVLKDEQGGQYHVMMNVRDTHINKDTMITYFYTAKTMDWSEVG